MQRGPFGAAVLGVMLGLAAPRDAEAAPRVPTRLVFDAPMCGSAQDFAARVMQRTSAVRFVQGAEKVVVRLRIEPSGSGLSARVSIEGRGRPSVTRRIESPDCNDALDALALVVAISVEARAERSDAAPVRGKPRRAPAPPPVEPEPAPVEPEPAPAEPPDVAPVPDAPPAEAPPSTPEPAPPPPAPTPAAPSPPPPESPPASVAEEVPSRFVLGAGLSALVSLGIAPDPLLGGAVWVSAGWERHDLWSPEVVLNVSHQRLGGVVEDTGSADFALNAASLALCPMRWGNESLEVRPCAAGSVGRFDSEGYETYDPRASTRPWGTLGGSAELTARVGIVELRAALSAGAPLIRDGFRFGGTCSGAACEDDAFHQVKSVIWSGAAGAGISVW